MITNLRKPDFFVPLAYPKSATARLEVDLTDPRCLQFIDAIASIVVHLSQQGERPRGPQFEVPTILEDSQ
jgi:hypothetical protein